MKSFSGPNAHHFKRIYKQIRGWRRKGVSFEQIGKQMGWTVENVKIFGGFKKIKKPDPLKTFETQYRNGARCRDKEYLLTFSEFVALVSLQCFYCGAPPRDRRIGKVSFKGNGIDRLDNSLGYVKGNVVSCCTVCNRLKNTQSADSFVDHCTRIAAYTPVRKVREAVQV